MRSFATLRMTSHLLVFPACSSGVRRCARRLRHYGRNGASGQRSGDRQRVVNHPRRVDRSRRRESLDSDRRDDRSTSKGGHIYPGLIDAQTSLGFPSAAPPRRGRGAAAARAAQPPPPALPETSPAYIGAREIKLSDDEPKRSARPASHHRVRSGVRHFFNGQSVVLNVGGGETASLIVRDPAAQQIAFNPRPAWTFPDSLMGVVAYIKQTFLDAQQYSAARAIYDRNPSGYRRQTTTASLQALAPVMRKEVPLVFIRRYESMMRRAEAIAREFNVR